ncbi:MAG: DNA-binding protein [Terriglobia bacterium]
MPERKTVEQLYTHRLEGLLNISGAKAGLESRAKADPPFQVNWNTVCDWGETSRYDHSTTETKARDMLLAVTDPSSGVLPWLKTQW